ncbi:hypothetical protein ACPMJQ_24385 [Streptomyces pseudogriseolus]|uniref:hypothetical protein n=1 Tax=Streptomyces pseudogriseolus TaxID=36817 RepID=UPI003FA2E098
MLEHPDKRFIGRLRPSPARIPARLTGMEQRTSVVMAGAHIPLPGGTGAWLAPAHELASA